MFNEFQADQTNGRSKDVDVLCVPWFGLVLVFAGIGSLSLDRIVYSPGEPMSVLIIPDAPTEEIVGTLKTDKVEDQEARKFKRYRNQRFSYRGPGLYVRFINAETTAPTEPGVYRMSLSGKTHATAPQTVASFAVSETLGRLTRRWERR
jgi:hypothetical protein